MMTELNFIVLANFKHIHVFKTKGRLKVITMESLVTFIMLVHLTIEQKPVHLPRLNKLRYRLRLKLISLRLNKETTE